MRYPRLGSSGFWFIHTRVASNRRAACGRLPESASMSPRLTSISSSRQTATDMGANASSSSPSQVTMDLTRLVRPEGSTVTGSPLRTTPEASVPAKPRKSRLGRMTYCTGKRRSVVLMSRAMGTVSRCSNNAGPWYHGPALLEHLETVPIARDINTTDLRFPVQYVIRPNLDFRGFAGTLASGVVRKGDPVTVLPSGRTSRVKSIVTWEGELAEAFAPMSVAVCLEDEIDVSRGDMLALSGNLELGAARHEATVVWMNQKPLEPNRSY